MANEKTYHYTNFNEVDNPHANRFFSDVVTGGIDFWGTPIVYIPMEQYQESDLDYIWGELKKKDYNKGYGMKMLHANSLEYNGAYSLSKFGFLDFQSEDTFFITIREFFQRMHGYDNVTEIDIIDGASPTGYSETDVLIYYKPNVSDLIWLPLHNKLYRVTLVDNKSAEYFQKYMVWKMVTKLIQLDHRDHIDISGSEGQGLNPDSLDISNAVPKVKDIQDAERITTTSIDPEVTGNSTPDVPGTQPLNKNVEIAKPEVTIDGAHDLFGFF